MRKNAGKIGNFSCTYVHYYISVRIRYYNPLSLLSRYIPIEF